MICKSAISRPRRSRDGGLKSFPATSHGLAVTTDPTDLDELMRELHARAHPPGPKPKRAAAKAAIAA
jgi:hypothetical protein